eukprot:3154469-Prorocentrum_lima.AAC.1
MVAIPEVDDGVHTGTSVQDLLVQESHCVHMFSNGTCFLRCGNVGQNHVHIRNDPAEAILL